MTHNTFYDIPIIFLYLLIPSATSIMSHNHTKVIHVKKNIVQIIYYSISPKSINFWDRKSDPWFPWTAWSPWLISCSIVAFEIYILEIFILSLLRMYFTASFLEKCHLSWLDFVCNCHTILHTSYPLHQTVRGHLLIYS